MNLFFVFVQKQSLPWDVVAWTSQLKLPQSLNYHPLELEFLEPAILGCAGFRSLVPRVPYCHVNQTRVVGEIRLDNREEVLAYLQKTRGDELIPACDRAIISEWENLEEIAARPVMLGDYAWVAWNAKSERLTAARDPLGVRPLFYAECDRWIAFSNFSEFFYGIPGFKKEVDEESIADFLMFEVDQDLSRTGFKHLHCLAPGTRMIWQPGGRKIVKDWAWSEQLVRLPSRQDYIDQFRLEWQRAAKVRCLDLKQATVMMSGGMDSSSVTAAISRTSPGVRVEAITGLYEKTIRDEERFYSSEVARYLQIPLHHVELDDCPLWQGYQTWEKRSALPMQGLALADGQEMLRTAAQISSVAFTGLPGDIVFQSEPFPYIRRCFEKGEMTALGQELAGDAIRHRRIPPLGFRTAVRDWWRQADFRAPFPYWISAEFARTHHLGERWQRFQPHEGLPSLRPRTLQTLLQAGWTRQFEREHHAVTGFPVQFRHPFFDLRLLGFLWSIPPIPYFFNKELLRVAMNGWLPEKVRLRAKSPLAGDHIRAKVKRGLVDWEEVEGDRKPLQPYLNLSQWPEPKEVMTLWHYPVHLRPLSLLCWMRVHNVSS